MWNGVEYSADIDMAEAFNKYFHSLPTSLNNALQPSNIDPVFYVKQNFLSNFNLYPVNAEEVQQIVLSLKNSKQKTNEISVEVFKSNTVVLSKVLSDIINLSFKSGIFPDKLKIAEIIPIFKSGDFLNIVNFRPISILPFVSKIFERSVHVRLQSF